MSLNRPRPPAPPTPPPPATRHVHLHVFDRDHRPLQGATARLQTQRDPEHWETLVTDPNGYGLWVVPDSLRDTHLQVTPPPAAKLVAIDRHDDVTPEPGKEVSLEAILLPVYSPLPRLVLRGKVFELETGARWTATECSDFNLLNRFQHEGERPVREVLDQRRAIGFTLLRVWTLYDLPGKPERNFEDRIGVYLDPDYTVIPDFLDCCGEYGFQVEFTAYTSTERVDHWGNLIAAIQPKTNRIVELVNEHSVAVNRLAHFAEYLKPSGILASHGSNASQEQPVTPVWDYAALHTNDSGIEEPRKIAHNGIDDIELPFNVPALIGETSRWPDVGMWRRRDGESEADWWARVLRHAEDAARGAAMQVAGSCFHSVCGKQAILFDAQTEAVARAWCAGAASVPLEYQDGLYYHRVDLETPADSRVYESRLPTGSFFARIRK